MTTFIRWLTAGLAVPVLTLAFVAALDRGVAADAAGPGGMKLPEAAYKELVQRGIATVQQGLQGAQDPSKTDKQKKTFIKQARGGAVMIAAYAQQSQTPANAQERATLRDAALKLAAAIKDGQYAEAKKQLDGLKTPLKPDPKADPKPIALARFVDIPEVMKQFSPLLGGSMLEKKLIKDWLDDDALIKKKELPPQALTDDYLLVIYQTAMVAEIIKDHVAQPKAGKGPRDWQNYSKDLSSQLAGLADAVGKKNGKAAWAALVKVDQSCFQCHKPFRDSDD